MPKAQHIAMLGHKRMLSREGGIEVVVNHLATRMAKLGHKVTCYERRQKGQNDPKMHDGVRLVPVPTVQAKGLAALSSAFFATLRACFSKASVVHIHAEGPALFCFLPKLFGKKTVVTVHGLDWQRQKWGKLAAFTIKKGEQNAVKYAHHIIVLSKNMQGYFLKTYARQTQFIPNGVLMEEALPPKYIQTQWGLSENSYLLYVGRIVPEKGLHYLLEAFSKLSTEKTLVVVGKASDTEDYAQKVKAQATKNVLFVGFQQGDVLKELYSNAYAYVLPSDVEGMPLTLLEAMSFGCCPVVSSIAECTEVVDGVGFVFRQGDVQSLTQALQKVVNNPTLVTNYKQQARKRVAQAYHWDSVVSQTLALYEK